MTGRDGGVLPATDNDKSPALSTKSPSPSLSPGASEPDAPSTTPANIELTTDPLSSQSGRRKPIWRILWDALNYVPERCRWDPNKPPQFSMAMNFMFAFAGCVTVANLYYNHPILDVLAEEFGVEEVEISQIPTVLQVGYAVGLLFLCPLGDLFRRRPFVIWLVFATATLWIVLCVTTSLSVFTGISFITAVMTVTPQLMLPLVGDLAPPNKRAAALSIVVSGLMMGILIARVISGIITNWVSWRYVYWMALGLQYLAFALLWLFMPDYPSSNPQGLNYFSMLWSIVTMLFKHPILLQSSIISFFGAATFTNFWTTLTFLLDGSPYNYSSLAIGLFGLIGIAGMLCIPAYSRLVTDKFVPLFSVLVGETTCLIGIIIGTYTGTFTVAGPVIQAFLSDLGLQSAQVANRSAIYTIEPKARNRVNTAFMVLTFCGQIMGTAAGNAIYAKGGWISSGSASVGFLSMSIFVALLRGPWEEGWVGWTGGASMRKKDKNSADGKTAETRAFQVEEPGVEVKSEGQGEEESGVGAREKVVVEKGAREEVEDKV